MEPSYPLILSYKTNSTTIHDHFTTVFSKIALEGKDYDITNVDGTGFSKFLFFGSIIITLSSCLSSSIFKGHKRKLAVANVVRTGCRNLLFFRSVGMKLHTITLVSLAISLTKMLKRKLAVANVVRTGCRNLLFFRSVGIKLPTITLVSLAISLTTMLKRKLAVVIILLSELGVEIYYFSDLSTYVTMLQFYLMSFYASV